MRMNSGELIAELKQARELWVEYDAERLKRHKAAEKEALKEWKTRLREAVKADYKTAKEKYHWTELSFRGPVCPVSNVRRIDGLIKQVEMSNQKVYTISPVGINSGFYDALMNGPDDPKDMCDG